MQDNRSDKVKRICKKYINNGCRNLCPLAVACSPKPGDTKAVFDERINEAEKHLKGECK